MYFKLDDYPENTNEEENVYSLYFEVFTLIDTLEKECLGEDIINSSLFINNKINLYSSFQLDSIENFTLSLNNLNEILDIKTHILYYLHCAFYYQSINIIEYIIDKVNFDLKTNDFYFIKLAIKYNLTCIFDYLIVEKKIDTFREETENGNSCLCYTVNYSRIGMMYKLLNTLNRKQQTKESLLLVQYALLTKNINILNLLYLHDYIDLKLLKNVEFTV